MIHLITTVIYFSCYDATVLRSCCVSTLQCTFLTTPLLLLCLLPSNNEKSSIKTRRSQAKQQDLNPRKARITHGRFKSMKSVLHFLNRMYLPNADGNLCSFSCPLVGKIRTPRLCWEWGSGYVYAGEEGQKEQGKDELAKPQKRPAHAND